MKKYILVAIIIILLLFVARYLENVDSNHKRHRSNSSTEAIQNKLLLSKYRLVNKSDSLFFTVEDAWVERMPLYIDDKFSKTDSDNKNFILNVKYKKEKNLKEENWGEKWITHVDGAISGKQGKYLSFENSQFTKSIFLKISLIKERYNVNSKLNTVYQILEFEQIE